MFIRINLWVKFILFFCQQGFVIKLKRIRILTISGVIPDFQKAIFELAFTLNAVVIIIYAWIYIHINHGQLIDSELMDTYIIYSR